MIDFRCVSHNPISDYLHPVLSFSIGQGFSQLGVSSGFDWLSVGFLRKSETLFSGSRFACGCGYIHAEGTINPSGMYALTVWFNSFYFIIYLTVVEFPKINGRGICLFILFILCSW